MPRTKQTARKSTGGKGPRRGLEGNQIVFLKPNSDTVEMRSNAAKTISDERHQAAVERREQAAKKRTWGHQEAPEGGAAKNHQKTTRNSGDEGGASANQAARLTAPTTGDVKKNKRRKFVPLGKGYDEGDTDESSDEAAEKKRQRAARKKRQRAAQKRQKAARKKRQRAAQKPDDAGGASVEQAVLSESESDQDKAFIPAATDVEVYNAYGLPVGPRSEVWEMNKRRWYKVWAANYQKRA